MSSTRFGLVAARFSPSLQRAFANFAGWSAKFVRLHKMRLSTIPTLLFFALLTGCAIQPKPLASCPASQIVPVPTNGEVIRLKAKGGHFASTPMKLARFGEQIPIRAAITQPDASTNWAASIAVCAVGPSERDQQCVHYYLDRQAGHLAASFNQHPSLGNPGQSAVQTMRVDVATRIALGLTLRENEFELLMCDGVRFKSQTPFPVHGYKLNCVGASCEFERPR